jgi:cytochrome c oxidase accessory protein FixG
MIRPWRRLAEVSQAVVIIGLPFLEIGGESALRFDIPSLELHFFGASLWIEEFFILLVAIIFLSLLLIVITLVLGRVWCGWSCPQTVLDDFTSFVDRARGKGYLQRLGAYAAVMIISILVAANLIWYFVSPYEFIPGVFRGTLGPVEWGFWVALTGILFLNFAFLRQTFCATVCPYAKLQGTLFDRKTLAVSFDPRREKECIDCLACVKACPVGIDIRKGLNAACIHCAECVDRCTAVMKPRKKASLVGYFFGQPGEEGRILRQNVLLVGTVAAAFLVFFIYLLVARTSVDMTVLPNTDFQPRISSDGSVINAYVLSLRNRGREHSGVKVSVDGLEELLKIRPDTVIPLEAGEITKVPIYIFARKGEHSMTGKILISLEQPGQGKVTTAGANFIFPEAR